MRYPFPTLVAGMQPSAMRSLTVLGAMVNKAASTAAVTTSGSGGALLLSAVGTVGGSTPGQDRGFQYLHSEPDQGTNSGHAGAGDAANVAYGCAR